MSCAVYDGGGEDGAFEATDVLYPRRVHHVQMFLPLWAGAGRRAATAAHRLHLSEAGLSIPVTGGMISQSASPLCISVRRAQHMSVHDVGPWPRVNGAPACGIDPSSEQAMNNGVERAFVGSHDDDGPDRARMATGMRRRARRGEVLRRGRACGHGDGIQPYQS